MIPSTNTEDAKEDAKDAVDKDAEIDDEQVKDPFNIYGLHPHWRAGAFLKCSSSVPQVVWSEKLQQPFFFNPDTNIGQLAHTSLPKHQDPDCSQS